MGNRESVMTCEWTASGYLKPTSPWLEAGNYYADHSSFAVPGLNSAGPKRLVSSTTPGQETTANIWEWTEYKCRLCKTDYIAVECVPFVSDPGGVGSYAQFSTLATGAVRIELSPYEDFSLGVFVEYETFVQQHTASTGLTILDANQGLTAFGQDYHGSLHEAFGRSAFLLAGNDASPASDVASHVSAALPSWTTQQFSHIPVSSRPILFPTQGQTGGILFDGSQPLTFIRAAMRFGAIEGGQSEERISSAFAIFPGRGFGYVYLSLGVHDAKAGGYANESFFSAAATDDAWLRLNRFARIKVRAAGSNAFAATRRRGTLQELSSSDGTAYPPFSISNPSPGVRSIRVRTVSHSDATASPKQRAAAQSTTDPQDLVWVDSPNPIIPQRAISLQGNDATSWRAARLPSVAPLTQPGGQPRQLSHGCFAVGKQLLVSTRCEFVSIFPTTSNEAAKLPSVAIINRFGDMSRPGDADSGWVVPPQWTEAPRSPAPVRDDYMANPPFVGTSVAGGSQINLGTADEFEAWAADYTSWIADQYGGAVQTIVTAGATGTATRQNEWAAVYAQSPNRPWMRHADGSHVITLAQHAGQPVYVAQQSPSNAMSPVRTLELPYFETAQLAEKLRITSGSPHQFPATWNGRYRLGTPQGVPMSTFSKGSICDGASWVDQYEYVFWPDYWAIVYDPWNGGTQISTGLWYGVHEITPTLPAWQYMASRRSMAAITSCSYTPLQLDCVADLSRGSSPSTAGWPASTYSLAQAWADDTIPKHEAIATQVAAVAVPAGGTVTINWRKTWQINLSVLHGPAAATGTQAETNRGSLLENDSFYPLLRPWYYGQGVGSDPDNMQAAYVDVITKQESVTVSWPGPNCVTKDYTFLHEDFWKTTITLTEQQWQDLENGIAVEVPVREVVTVSGANRYTDYISQQSSTTTSGFASAGGVPGAAGTVPAIPEAKQGSVTVRLFVTLQFT